MKDATVEAIRLGWRHIDTARAYENEDVVGQAIRKAIKEGYISSADELFITGKLWNGDMNPKDVATALDNTLNALGVDKIDMYLNHWPWPNVTRRDVQVTTAIPMRCLIFTKHFWKPGAKLLN